MATVSVHRYRVYDILADDYHVSTRMATKDQIERIGGEIIPDTEFRIDEEFIKDGWTEKNFEPLRHIAVDLERRLQERSN